MSGQVAGRREMRKNKILQDPNLQSIIERNLAALNKMPKKERDSFLEDLLASTSPEYLKSIKEARADYKAAKVKTHKEVFDL